PVLFTPGQSGRLNAHLQKADPARMEARKLVALPQGRHAIQYQPDYVSTLLPTVQHTREVAYLLTLDAVRRAPDGDGRGAVESCLASLNAGRSLGDEPCLICQIVRGACRRLTARAIERTLALTEPPPETLAEVQRAIQAEEAEPIYLYGLRGERAGVD